MRNSSWQSRHMSAFGPRSVAPWILARTGTLCLYPHTADARLGGFMADVDLRPMNLGEFLDRTFKLYKSNFVLFAGITAVPALVLMILQLISSWMQTEGVRTAQGRGGQAGPASSLSL